jgi:hypothetical protein
MQALPAAPTLTHQTYNVPHITAAVIHTADVAGDPYSMRVQVLVLNSST